MKSLFTVVSFLCLCVGQGSSRGTAQIGGNAAGGLSSDGALVAAASQAQSPHGKDPGIGPVKTVQLGPINHEMAEKGKQLFDANCTACHALNQRKIGPPLENVANQRSPEFIMNLLLNTSQMEDKDKVMKQLEAEYGIKMPNLDLDRQQAREVLEYLRSVAK